MARAVKLNISLEGELNKAVEKSKFRIGLLLIIVVISYLAIAVKTTVLSLSGEHKNSIITEDVFSFLDDENQKIVEQDLTFDDNLRTRKSIYDRNGILLATDLITSSLYAHPHEMIEHNYAAQLVHKAIPSLSIEYLTKQFYSGKKFRWIKRNLTPKQKYDVNSLGIPGLYFEDETKRIYPHKNLFAHAIGMVGVDAQGLSGIERFLDRLKKGEFGNEINEDKYEFIKEKDEILTTLDIRVQNIVHEELTAQLKKHKAKAAAGIVMNANNGEVLALVSLPDFDSNTVRSNDRKSLFNHATLGSYELGSVFKPITFAAALEEGDIKMWSKFDASEPIKLRRFYIRDFHPEKRVLNVPEIMMYSSNIGTAKIAEKLGESDLEDYFQELGFYDKSPIEIPEKSMPNMPRKWGETKLYTASYGHGIAVSPIHLITAFTAIVNGGVLYKPTLIKSVVKPEGKRIFSEKNSLYMRKLLRLVVTRGTAKKAKAEGYLVGGKTGTAEKINDSGRYDRDNRITSFIGAFPMNKPKYLVFTLFDEPQATKDTYGYATAGWIAAPAAGKIISRIAPLLKVMPVDENDSEANSELEIRGIEIR